MRVATVTEEKVSLEASHLEDIRLASSKMTGANRNPHKFRFPDLAPCFG
jgi:hypothetical protein